MLLKSNIIIYCLSLKSELKKDNWMLTFYY